MNVTILVTVDIDNDGATSIDQRTELRWEGLKCIPSVAQVMAGCGLRTTWFVRADGQLGDVYGSAAYMLDVHAALWQGLQTAGDEIAWHPHIYYRCTGGRYVPDRDEGSCARQLRQVHQELTARGRRFASVRIGEAFGANGIMAELALLGLRVDSSALPGRQRSDASRIFDWGPTPNAPYRPSRHDYRVPSTTDAYDILEVPMTTVPIRVGREASPLPRYLNLAYRPEIFRDAVGRLLDASAAAGCATLYLTTILHPDETLPAAAPNPLYAFAVEAVGVNVRCLLRMVEDRGLDWVPATMREVPDMVGTMTGGHQHS